MDRPTQDRREVYQQTKQHYKFFQDQESLVIRRAKNLTPQEMASLEYKYPRHVVAPIINDDCIYVALDYVKQGYNPIILNMSSWRHAGGGVENGAGAQEEELFRRSNYFKHLHQKYYPFSHKDVIISKGVEFLRNGRDKGYTRMAAPLRLIVLRHQHPEILN